jgi:putative aldouronate transport system substrate-binding protein
MRKKLAIILITTILLNTIGCSNQKKDKETTNEALKPITLTFYNEDGNIDTNYLQDPISKKIKEKTGVVIKYESPIGDSSNNVDLMISSNEYPDLVYVKSDQDKLISKGSFINLRDLIDKYGPNIKKFYGEDLNKFKGNAKDDGIYYLASYAREEKRLTPQNGFQLQHAVVKYLGYPEIKTLKDFENAIREYKEKNPVINGKEAIGLSLVYDDWRWMTSIGNAASMAGGIPDDGQWAIDVSTYEATYKFLLPQVKEYFRWLNHMNNINLLDPDSFVQKYDQYKEKISSGRVLALSDAVWEYKEAEVPLKEKGEYDRTYGIYPVVLNEKYKYPDFREVAENNDYGIGISVSCKDPVRAIKFLDWLCSDEAQVLNNWGIEGVNYDVINGKRVINSEEWKKRNEDSNFINKTGIGIYTYPFPQWGIGKKDSTGQLYNPVNEELIVNNYNPSEKETLNAYGKKLWKDLYPDKSELLKSQWGSAWTINISNESELYIILNKCNSIMKSKIPQAVLCKTSEFDKVWDGIMTELKDTGVEKANKEFTKLVKEKVESNIK